MANSNKIFKNRQTCQIVQMLFKYSWDTHTFNKILIWKTKSIEIIVLKLTCSSGSSSTSLITSSKILFSLTGMQSNSSDSENAFSTILVTKFSINICINKLISHKHNYILTILYIYIEYRTDDIITVSLPLLKHTGWKH